MQAVIQTLRELKETLKKRIKRIDKRMQGHITIGEGYELASEIQGIEYAIKLVNRKIRLLKR